MKGLLKILCSSFRVLIWLVILYCSLLICPWISFCYDYASKGNYTSNCCRSTIMPSSLVISDLASYILLHLVSSLTHWSLLTLSDFSVPSRLISYCTLVTVSHSFERRSYRISSWSVVRPLQYNINVWPEWLLFFSISALYSHSIWLNKGTILSGSTWTP